MIIGYLTLTLKIDGKWSEAKKQIWLSDWVLGRSTADEEIALQCARSGKSAAIDALIIMERGQCWHRALIEPRKGCNCEACKSK